ncbi:hypothetical protein [Hydromonas duriensis]|nr:hypothetical protein [Hydromonas duriensis]
MTLLLCLSMFDARAEPRVFDKATWIELASQTCIREAPHSRTVSALHMNDKQIRYSCRCVAKDMLTILPTEERLRLMQQMQTQHNLQQIEQQMLKNPKIKSSIAECSAASYWWS